MTNSRLNCRLVKSEIERWRVGYTPEDMRGFSLVVFKEEFLI